MCMDLLFCIKNNSNDETPNWRVKSSVGVSYPQFLHSIVREQGRIEVPIDSLEGGVLVDSSVNLPPLWELLSAVST